MARPLRIEYENAVYHVMNRGRGRAMIFHNETFSSLFLKCLEEAAQQFGLEILAYCLMGNHYHLLVRTPRANLSRCMRHVNGTYTQRYNKLKNTDGSLFRGRYKAIVVDVDSYLLQVSRYIHRNPIDAKKPLVDELAHYTDSSYPTYINQVETPIWLNRDFVLSALNTNKRYSAYQAFVENKNAAASELDNFYSKEHQPAVLGTKTFAAKIKQHALKASKEISRHHLRERISMKSVINKVARYFEITPNEILHVERGGGKKNLPRQMAMYLCKQYTGATLNDIAGYFKVGHYSTVSQAVRRLKEKLLHDRLVMKTINMLSQDLTP
jgi:putative transposase